MSSQVVQQDHEGKYVTFLGVATSTVFISLRDKVLQGTATDEEKAQYDSYPRHEPQH